jgi:hypothetical protein
MGPLDEWLTSRLISAWRDQVWQDTIRLIDLPSMTKAKQSEWRYKRDRSSALPLIWGNDIGNEKSARRSKTGHSYE